MHNHESGCSGPNDERDSGRAGPAEVIKKLKTKLKHLMKFRGRLGWPTSTVDGRRNSSFSNPESKRCFLTIDPSKCRGGPAGLAHA